MYINITGRFRVRFISRWNYTWQLEEVSGIRCYNSQELLLWIKKCILISFVTFVIRSEGEAPNQQFVSLSRQCSSTTIGFGQGFPSKEKCDNTGASPILSLPVYSLFLPVSLIVISIGGTALLSCYWHHSECDQRAQKLFAKWLPGMFQALLQSLAGAYICTKGFFCRKCNLHVCTILYRVIEKDGRDLKPL